MPKRLKSTLALAARGMLAAGVAAVLAGTGFAAAANGPASGERPLKEFMAHVLQRNATQLWAWSAYVSDEHGDRYTSPANEAQWEDAESDALTVAELARSLMSDDRRLDGDWDRYAGALREAAEESASAAEHHNLEALVAAGNTLADRCTACHLHYVPELEGAPPRAAGTGQPALRR